MRYPTEKSVDAFFVEDIKDGVKVECMMCMTITTSTEEFGDPLYCPKCGRELHYRPEWSW